MNMGIIVVIIIAGMLALGVFFGAIGKTFKQAPPPMDSSAVQTQAEQSIQDTKDKEQKLMDDMKQKMEDMQQR
jgi:hypothetical protein